MVKVINSAKAAERTTIILGPIAAKARKHRINVSLVCREAVAAAVRAIETGKAQSLRLDP